MALRLKDSAFLDRSTLREEPSAWSATSKSAMVVSAHYRATEAGAEILADGGNAIDAAVAVSAALGVVEPAASGLGGMTFMMVHLKDAGRTFIIEGPCLAPLEATPEKVLSWVEEVLPNFKYDKEKYKTEEEIVGLIRRGGPQAVALPTNPAVLSHALKRYGTLPASRVLEPAIRLAKEGFAITPFQHRLLAEYGNKSLKDAVPHFFAGENNTAAPVGSVVRQQALTDTLKRMAAKGFEDFYTGEIGEILWRDISERGGYLSEKDFRQFPELKETKPIETDFYNWRVCSTPPPGGGTTLLEMLNLYEAVVPDGLDSDSPEAALLFARLIRKARMDRRIHSRGMAYGGSNHSPDLLGKSYAEEVAKELRSQLEGYGETTHFNVADSKGNVVAVTQSIERSFGARIATNELGFLYNGFLRSFKLRNKKHPHYLKPGASSRSNAMPSIIFERGRPRYAIGSTGSERMASGIFETLVRLRSQNPFQAVKAPRLHCNPEGVVFLEAERFTEEAVRLLKERGFVISPYDSWAFAVGGLHLIAIDENGKTGIAEPRRDGMAMGI